MNILVANDDGIEAEGIKHLVNTLSTIGDVYVFAPEGQRSASSHALSISRPIKITKVDFCGAEEAWRVDGTPADCVKLGFEIMKRKGLNVDIVCSGINHGANLGGDTVYSGTVSAAAEGAFLGVPAVAASVNSHNPQYFEGCCKAVAAVFPFALNYGGKGRVININTPDIPTEEIKGLIPAKLGTVLYDELFEIIEEDGDEVTYRYSGQPVSGTKQDEEADTLLVDRGYGTISVVQYDLNDYEGLEMLKGWEIDLK